MRARLGDLVKRCSLCGGRLYDRLTKDRDDTLLDVERRLRLTLRMIGVIDRHVTALAEIERLDQRLVEPFVRLAVFELERD